MNQVKRWRPATARPSGSPPSRSRPSRLRLFGPAALLAAAGAVACGFWAFASWRTDREIDAWLQREAAHGRDWTCPARRIGGFPFRIEVSCDKPSFKGRAENRAVAGQIGRVLAVAQVYSPTHVIVEADGPLELRDDAGGALSMAWESLRASVIGKPGSGLERISVEMGGPTLVANNDAGAIETGARAVELHLRRTPDRPAEDGAYDVAATLNGVRLPALDALFNSGEPTDATMLATVTKAEPLGAGGFRRELDRWRDAGGRLQVTSLALLKGGKRVDANGSLGLDELHRAQGRVELTLTGLDELLQSLGVSSRTAAIGGLIAGVLGGKRPADAAPPPPGATGALKGVTLPLRLDSGKAYLGPIPVARLAPLY
jgi:hypothetical protein